jgi:hypothetical protein
MLRQDVSERIHLATGTWFIVEVVCKMRKKKESGTLEEGKLKDVL